MTAALPDLETLIAALPEIYQPIYGHPPLSAQASRGCEDRLQQILAVHDALARQLGRPVRVLDLGCAQGWFGFNLARAGAQVLGIDYLAANINVCNRLLLENRGLQIRFNLLEIEQLPLYLKDNQFDLVLGLSVFHHLCYHNGKEWTRRLLGTIFEKIPVAILEMALAQEPMAWASAQPDHPDYLLAQAPFYRILSRHPTHLSSIDRPLYICSGYFWYFGGKMGAFSRWQDNGRGRRYFFGEDTFATLYRTDGQTQDVNRAAIAQSASFLAAPPAGYDWAPKLRHAGEAHGAAWLVRDKIPGAVLMDLINRGDYYDERAVLLGVLRQLAALEAAGLYHSDLRVWNVIIGPDFFPVLIDYNEITTAKRDCVWPDSPFLAFFNFAREVITHRQLTSQPTRPPFISPYNLPQPYRRWAGQLWQQPVSRWSFAFLLETLEQINETEADMIDNEDSAQALWMRSIEQNLYKLHEAVRAMDPVMRRLHETVVANHQLLHQHIAEADEPDGKADIAIARR